MNSENSPTTPNIINALSIHPGQGKRFSVNRLPEKSSRFSVYTKRYASCTQLDCSHIVLHRTWSKTQQTSRAYECARSEITFLSNFLRCVSFYSKGFLRFSFGTWNMKNASVYVGNTFISYAKAHHGSAYRVLNYASMFGATLFFVGGVYFVFFLSFILWISITCYILRFITNEAAGVLHVNNNVRKHITILFSVAQKRNF